MAHLTTSRATTRQPQWALGCHSSVSGSRDEEFDAFVRVASPRLLRLAVLLTAEEHAGRDLLQDALERVYLAWSRVHDPMAYTRRALTNGGKNRWRWQARHPEAHLLPGVEPASTTDPIAQLLDRDSLLRALALLTAHQRAVIALRFFEDLSEAQTAQLLGITVGTVKSQTSKSLLRLRAALAQPETSTHEHR